MQERRNSRVRAGFADAPWQDADAVVCNGIDGSTGRYALDPVPVRAIADLARRQARLDGVPEPSPATRGFNPSMLGMMQNLDEMGWGVIFARDTGDDVRAALEPLLARRKAQAGSLFKVLDFDPQADSFRAWLRRHDVAPGETEWEKVPFYLLIVGSPASIPFEFQYLLDVEYAVGRVDFETAEEYGAYVQSLLSYEQAEKRLAAREIVYWGPHHAGDMATELSTEALLDALATNDRHCVATKRKFRKTTHLRAEGTKTNLAGVLHRPASAMPPALLFAAAHGVSWTCGEPEHHAAQGALLGQEWELFDPVEPKHYLAPADIGSAARIHGMMAFLFACFGAGTPASDSYRKHREGAPATLADPPFVAPLPRRLLAHPGGGALAVIGHVDRAWGFSIQPRGLTPKIGRYRNCVEVLLRGLPAGLATTDFSQRYAMLSTDLLAHLDRAPAGGPTDREIAWAWIERNDSQNYILLGDPAARLRPEVLL